MEILKTPKNRMDKGFSDAFPRGRKNEQNPELHSPSFSSTTSWKNYLWKVKISLKTSGIKHSTKITEKLKVNIVECGMLRFLTTSLKQDPVENYKHRMTKGFSTVSRARPARGNKAETSQEPYRGSACRGTLPRFSLRGHPVSCRGCF